MTHDPSRSDRLRHRYRRLLAAVDGAVAAGRELAKAAEALDRAMLAPALRVADAGDAPPAEAAEAKEGDHA
jgi:hypothetical protein